MPDTGTTYRQLRWIAEKAGLKPGWAYYRFLDMEHRGPTTDEIKGKSVVPSDVLVAEAEQHMNPYRFNRLKMAHEYACLSDEQKAERREEWLKTDAFRRRAKRALDANRPRLEDL